MPVNLMKQKKDGARAYKEDCQAVALGMTTTQCDGEVTRATKRTTSFGVPFIAYSYLCDAHAQEFEFKK